MISIQRSVRRGIIGTLLTSALLAGCGTSSKVGDVASQRGERPTTTTKRTTTTERPRQTSTTIDEADLPESIGSSALGEEFGLCLIGEIRFSDLSPAGRRALTSDDDESPFSGLSEADQGIYREAFGACLKGEDFAKLFLAGFTEETDGAVEFTAEEQTCMAGVLDALPGGPGAAVFDLYSVSTTSQDDQSEALATQLFFPALQQCVTSDTAVAFIGAAIGDRAGPQSQCVAEFIVAEIGPGGFFELVQKASNSVTEDEARTQITDLTTRAREQC